VLSVQLVLVAWGLSLQEVEGRGGVVGAKVQVWDAPVALDPRQREVVHVHVLGDFG